MRRMMLGALIGLGIWMGTGCIAVAKNNRFCTGREAVTVDGRVYVIDTQRGTAREVDLSKATPFDADQGTYSDND